MVFFFTADMVAQKEQMMSSIKQEMALANAQELVNVCPSRSDRYWLNLTFFTRSENQRQVLREMHNQTW